MGDECWLWTMNGFVVEHFTEVLWSPGRLRACRTWLHMLERTFIVVLLYHLGVSTLIYSISWKEAITTSLAIDSCNGWRNLGTRAGNMPDHARGWCGQGCHLYFKLFWLLITRQVLRNSWRCWNEASFAIAQQVVINFCKLTNDRWIVISLLDDVTKHFQDFLLIFASFKTQHFLGRYVWDLVIKLSKLPETCKSKTMPSKQFDNYY